MECLRRIFLAGTLIAVLVVIPFAVNRFSPHLSVQDIAKTPQEWDRHNILPLLTSDLHPCWLCEAISTIAMVMVIKRGGDHGRV